MSTIVCRRLARLKATAFKQSELRKQICVLRGSKRRHAAATHKNGRLDALRCWPNLGQGAQAAANKKRRRFTRWRAACETRAGSYRRARQKNDGSVQQSSYAPRCRRRRSRAVRRARWRTRIAADAHFPRQRRASRRATVSDGERRLRRVKARRAGRRADAGAKVSVSGCAPFGARTRAANTSLGLTFLIAVVAAADNRRRRRRRR